MGRAFEFRKARKMKRWSKMAKTFTRIGKDIVMAVKEGGADPDTNSRLRQIIQNAKTVNMPKENIIRAIKKASDKDTANYEEISLEGYAVTGIKIPGIQHEFSTIDGIVEDVSEIILNLKNVRFKATGENPEKSIVVKFDSKGTLTAQSIEKSTSSFKVLNPKQEICTMSKKVKFSIELRVEQGRRYVTSEENNANSADVFGWSRSSRYGPN